MANYVTISALGPANVKETDPPDGQEAVDRMIRFWQEQLDQVLYDQPDLIVVPEVCDRYACHTPEQRKAYYEERGDQVRDFFAGIARKHHSHVAYSADRHVADGVWANSTQILGRDGSVLGVYNKNHPTIGEIEDDGTRAGTAAPLIECDFGRVACAICFDLNFDELRLRYAEARPDLIVFCSMYHGGLMQAYWAYSCRAHFVAALHGLPCAIISPVGEVLARSTNYFHFVTARVNLDCVVAHLDGNRDRLRAAQNKYGRKVKIFDPGLLASVLISSETDEFTAADLAREFEIERLDPYFHRAHSVRNRPEVLLDD